LNPFRKKFLGTLLVVLLPGEKWPGYGVTHPPPSSAEVKERIELHHYPSLHPHDMLEGERLYVEIAAIWLQMHSQKQKKSQGSKSAKEGEG
jgi:hypothetical protein